MLFAKPRVPLIHLAFAMTELQMLCSPASFVDPGRYSWGTRSRMTGFKSLVSSPRAALMQA